MYTKEQKFSKNLVDLAMQLIPPRYIGANGNKIKQIYYNQVEEGYVSPFDQGDPQIVKSILDWIKGTEVVRSQVGLGAIVGTGCNVTSTNNGDGTFNLEITVDSGNQTGLCEIDGDDNALSFNNWYLQEFYGKTDNQETIFSTNTGNYAMDICGGLGEKRAGEWQYTNADGNHPSMICQYFIDDTHGWYELDRFQIAFRNVEPGQKIYLNNLSLYELTPAP